MRYRRKIEIVDAVQFVAGEPLPEGVVVTALDKNSPSMGNHPVIRYLEGELHVQDGDWIITNAHGRQYPCHPAVFAHDFEALEH